MDNIYIPILFCFLLILTKIQFNKYDKKIDNMINIVEHFNIPLDDTNDRQTIANFFSLAKGGPLTLNGLNITGNIDVVGNANVSGALYTKQNATVDGKLVVNNGSSFNGGRHHFEDEEKAGKLRVGAAWGTPGLYAEDGKKLILGNNSIQNIYMNGDETIFNNSSNDKLIIKNNRLQCPAGNYEMNFSSDGWIRVLTRNTGDMGDYNGNGIAAKSVWIRDGGYFGGNYDSPFVKYDENLRIKRYNSNLWLSHDRGWGKADFWDRTTNEGILVIKR